ncbi:membrane anchor subunit of succinate dehydrogenase, Sdh4 [Blyttiomyces sp. JEL0837]|nr:membrane anchor subunit of succinate dehydrogenase, Sdh4 [Blyttiomyces sp. JEL0837]
MIAARTTASLCCKARSPMAMMTMMGTTTSRASFHSARVALFQKSAVARSDAAAATPHEHKSKVHGSYHWTAERALSIVTIPLIASAVIAGPIPLVDLALGVVIPVHTHMGFDVMIQDYVPKRKYGILNTLCTWSLRGVTLLVLYGAYEFNTNDVGITALVQRLWTNKL